MRDLNINYADKMATTNLTGSQACKPVGEFIYKSPSDRESLELEAHFNPADTTDTMKPYGTWHPTESRQYKFDLNFNPDGRGFGRKYKHSTLAYVYAVPAIVVVHAVGPAKQEWQSYLKPPRIPSLNRLIHFRPQFSFADRLTLSMTGVCYKRGIVLGERGRCPALDQGNSLFALTIPSPLQGGRLLSAE